MLLIKKFLVTLVLIFFLGGNVSANILLECKYVKGNDSFWGDNVTPDNDEYYYYKISSDFKLLQLKGSKEKLKKDCAIGSCEKIEAWNEYPDLPLKKETTEYLYYGREWFENRSFFDNHTINKTNLQLVTFDNLMLIEANTFGNPKDVVVESQNFRQCKEIKKFPF